MATNYDSPGRFVTISAPYAALKGNPIQISQLFGIATHGAAISTDVLIDTEGAHWVAIETGRVITVGMPLYYKDDGTPQEKLELSDDVAITPTKNVGVALDADTGDGSTRNVRVRIGKEKA